MVAYMVMLGFGALFVLLAVFIAKRFPVQGVEDFIVAGRKLPFGLISASVMVSWIWTITLLGSAEAGFWYGIGGGLGYSIGSIVPFMLFIPIVLRLRKIMPRGITFTEYSGVRYGRTTQIILCIYAIAISLYIATEQMIGIGYMLSSSFNLSYEAVVITAIVVVTLYVSIAGLRGSVINDLIMFFFVAIVAFILVPIVLSRFGIQNLFDGLKDVVTNPNNPNHNPDALNIFAPGAMRYMIIALVVSLGFVFLDQGYYSKALSTISNKTLLWSYLVGTIIAWAPIPILFGGVLGGTGLAMKLVPGDQIKVTTEVAPYVMNSLIPGVGIFFFSLVVFMAGMTTAADALVGLQAIFTVDLQEKILGRETKEIARTRFGRWAVLVFGIVVMGGAILLEGHSLLYIDIMSGILFASPVAAFILGMFWKRISQPVAITSMTSGLAGGITSYILVKNPDIDYFVGNLVSLCLPIVVIFIGSVFSKHTFNYNSLLKYRNR